MCPTFAVEADMSWSSATRCVPTSLLHDDVVRTCLDGGEKLLNGMGCVGKGHFVVFPCRVDWFFDLRLSC